MDGFVFVFVSGGCFSSQRAICSTLRGIFPSQGSLQLLPRCCLFHLKCLLHRSKSHSYPFQGAPCSFPESRLSLFGEPFGSFRSATCSFSESPLSLSGCQLSLFREPSDPFQSALLLLLESLFVHLRCLFYSTQGVLLFLGVQRFLSQSVIFPTRA